MPTSIDPLIRFLADIGIVDVFLPFVLVFTMVYAFLEKTKVFGEQEGHSKHKINAIIAVVIGLFVVGSANILNLTNTIVQYIGLLSIIVISFALLLGLFGVEHLPQSKVWNSIFFVIFMVISIYVFGELGWFGRGNDFFIVIFVLFFLILFFIKIWLAQDSAAPDTKINEGSAGGHSTSKRGAGPVSKKAQAQKAASHKRPQEPEGVPTEEELINALAKLPPEQLARELVKRR